MRDITIFYPVGTAIMEINACRTMKRQAYLARNSPTKPLSGSALEHRSILDCLETGVCGQVDIGMTSTSSLESESDGRAVA